MKSIAMFLLLTMVGCGADMQPAGKTQILGAVQHHLLRNGAHMHWRPAPNGFDVSLIGKFNWTKLRPSLRHDANKLIRYYNRKVSNMSEMETQSMSTIYGSRLVGKIIETDNGQEDNTKELSIAHISYEGGKITKISEADNSQEENVAAAIEAHQLAVELALIKNKLGAARKIMERIIRVSESVDHRVQLQVDMQDRGMVFLNRDNLDDVVQYLHGEVQRVKSE